MPRFLTCPECTKHDVVRSRCFSAFERLAGLALRSPFQCRACSHRFLALRVGRLYRTDVIERREHPRISVRLALSFSGGRVRGTGTVVDISMGGCVVESETAVQVDDIFYLRLAVGEHALPIEVAAMVRSVSRRGIGFKFLRGARENKRLFDFLHAQSAPPSATGTRPASLRTENNPSSS